MSDKELGRLHDAGVRGARFNFWKQLNIAPTPAGFLRQVDRIREYGWHAKVHCAGDEWLELRGLLAKVTIPVVIDHMGHPDLKRCLDQPMVRVLLDLLKSENWWVTISNADRFSAAEHGWVDALPFAQRFIEAAPDRAIWCTDWPHVQYPKPMPNDAELLEFLYRVAPDAEQRRKILAANPARLFGFSDPPAWVRQESEGKHEHTHADAPAATSIDSLTESDDKVELKGSPIVAAIKASGVEFVISVPDIVTSAGVLRPIADDPELKLIRVSKEDECIGIASGLHYYDKRALSLIQHTGFLDSINAIRGVAVEHAQPICMMIGLLEYDSRRPPRDSSRYGVRIIEPILDAMGIPHHLINQDADVARIRTAIEDAYATSHPVALLIGRRPSAS